MVANIYVGKNGIIVIVLLSCFSSILSMNSSSKKVYDVDSTGINDLAECETGR